jgi:hypothetical protein
MKFAHLFAISVSHSYYADGVCPDFVIDPAPETGRVLKNHRCLVRSRTDGAVVAAELAADGKPLLSLDPSMTLTFQMRLRNEGFLLMTDPVPAVANRTPLYIVPTGSSGASRDLTLTTRAGPAAAGVFAEIDIPTSALPAAGGAPIEFRIRFEAKKARWTYYCVTDLNMNGKELQIVDTDSSPAALRFSPSNRTDLKRNPDPADSVARQLARQYPELARFRFVSDDLVACRQAPRRQIELRLDGNRFPEPLPNPSLANYLSLAMIVDGKPSQQAGWFQVVTYTTHLFTTKGE